MTHWMRPPERDPLGKREVFDPVVEGGRQGVPRELSLALWERACAEATDSWGRHDPEQAQRRFHELTVRIAARGGLRPEIGKVTRVGDEIDSDPIAAWNAYEQRSGAPGRETLVAVEGRQRKARGGEAFHRPEYDDYRVVGLKEVLHRLRGNHLLRQETIAAAFNIDRSIAGRATLWREPLLGTTTPNGQALWRAAERRAVTLYRRATKNGAVDAQDSAIEPALQQRGAGEPLHMELRLEMERELGVSLAGVRIHTDGVAAQAARALEAEAFTVGEDIFFAEGAFTPDTHSGRKLLIHELTHVAQVLRGDTSPTGDGLRVSQPGERLEQEADAISESVAMRLHGAAMRGGTRLGETLARATAGPPAEVPFRPALERFFGRPLPAIDAFTGRSELGDFGARAAATGHTVVFAESTPSLPVVAHEVAHVLQQDHAGSPRKDLHEIADEETPAEREADAAAHAIASGRTAVFAVRERPAPIVHLEGKS